jgi:hypothetical protein
VPDAHPAHRLFLSLGRDENVSGERLHEFDVALCINALDNIRAHFEKRGKKGLRVLVAEKSWEGLAENLDEAHDAPNSPVAAVLTIKGWVNDKGPCFKYTDPDRAWDRIALSAQALAFDEIPGRQKVKDWWQRAYARWCRLRQDVAGVLAAREPAGQVE